MTEIKKALTIVYVGYACRYLYLLILIPFYSRVLGPNEYGKVLAAMALGNFVWVIQNWGFSVVGARNIASNKSPSDRCIEFGRQLSGRLIILPGAVLLGMAGTWWSPMLREAWQFGVLATIFGVISGFNLGWYFQGSMQFKIGITSEILSLLISLPLILFTVRGPSDSINVLLSLVIGVIISTAYSYRKAAQTTSIRPSSLKAGKESIKESGPMFISAGAGSLVGNGGTYLLSLQSTPDQVAFYGTAERVVSTLLALLNPAGQVLLSWFSRLSAEGAKMSDELNAKRKRALLIVGSAGATASLLSATVASALLTWFLGENFTHAGEVLRTFSPIFLLSALNHAMVVYFLLPARSDKSISFIGVFCALLATMLMYFTASNWGASGIAASRVATELVSCMLLFYATSRIPKR
jgi:O-antigen/teichoic acid export membrane protein